MVTNGIKVGPYHITWEIAEGEISRICHATTKDGRRDVALKLLKPKAAEIVRKMRGAGVPWEGDIAVRFDHPHVIRAFEHGIDGHTYFIAFDLLDPFTLEHLLHAQSPLVMTSRYRILYKLAKGLTYVHKKGYVHGDICLRNILLAQNGSPKLADFSLAAPRPAGDVHHMRRLRTPTYAAPELLTDTPVDERTDIYAFGATAYELLTGCSPFAARRGAAPPPPSEHESAIPEAVDRLLLRAIAPDPEQRFQTMFDVVQTMRVAFPNEAIAGSSGRSHRESRRFDRVGRECFVRLRTRRWGLLSVEHRTVTKDLTVAGLSAVYLKSPLKIGTRLDIELLPESKSAPMALRGRVQWCRKSGAQDTYEVGIGFLGTPETVRHELERHVAARRPSGPPFPVSHAPVQAHAV